MDVRTVVLILIIQLTASQSENGFLEVCEDRPRFSFNILDAIVVDTIEFFLESTCNRTMSDAFDTVFWCFSKILELPHLQLAWTYRNYQPRTVGLKNYFCLYTLEAGKCHDFESGLGFFSCPANYTDQIMQMANILVGNIYDYFCSGDGIVMISLIASHGDACLTERRPSLISCMYHTHPTLRQISVEHLRSVETEAISSQLLPICSALEVIRHCALQTYSKCSTPIPANILNRFLLEFGDSINCQGNNIKTEFKPTIIEDSQSSSRRLFYKPRNMQYDPRFK